MLSRKNVTNHLLSLGVLTIGFLLCRYVLFDLHGMKQWPVILLGVGLSVMLISFFARGRLVPRFIPAAYLIGFAAGVIFRSNGVDAGGGRTNNLWIIWTAVFIVLLAAGIVCELLFVREKNV